MTELIEVPFELLQKMFDLVIGSMDFGSGFFDKEDHDAIADAADLLGVNCPESSYFYGFRDSDNRLKMVPRESTYCDDAPVVEYRNTYIYGESAKAFNQARLDHPGHFIGVVDGKAKICGGARYSN